MGSEREVGIAHFPFLYYNAFVLKENRIMQKTDKRCRRMNPYNLDTEIIMQENKGTLFAGKVYRERKFYQVLMMLWQVVILETRQ